MRTTTTVLAAIGCIVLLLAALPPMVGASYTHPYDTTYEARISLSQLKIAGSHTQDAVRIASLNNHRDGAHPMNLVDRTMQPKDGSAFLNGYTDEFMKPQVVFNVSSGEEFTGITITFPEPHTLAMPSFTAKVMTVRTAHTIPPKYLRTKKERLRDAKLQGEGDKYKDVDDLDTENDDKTHADRTHDTIMHETLVTPTATTNAANFKFDTPHTADDLFDTVIVILHIHPRIITSFVYELEGVPEEVYTTGQLYDLTPFNTTMNMKFVTKYNEDDDTMGIWVVRRAPIPHFTLLVAIDGELILSRNVVNPSPAGEGIASAIPHARARAQAVIRIVVHFYEQPLEELHCFDIPDFQSRVVKQLVVSESNPRPHIDIPIPGIAPSDSSSRSTNEFALRFTNDGHKESLTASFVQPRAISSLLLSFYASKNRQSAPLALHQKARDHAPKEGEVAVDKPVLVFREFEMHVPHIDPSAATQFGWYSAVSAAPAKTLRQINARLSGSAARSSSQSKSKSQSKSLSPNADTEEPSAQDITQFGEEYLLSVCVGFNSRVDSKDTIHDMAGWIEDYGGDISRLSSTAPYDDTIEAAYRSQVPHWEHGRIVRSSPTTITGSLFTRQSAKAGDTLGTVPYKLLLSVRVAEADRFVQKVMQNATTFIVTSHKLKLDVRQNQHFMLFTLFTLLKSSSSLDGINWRLYFDTIPFSHKPNLPVFYTQAELDLFKFSPLVYEHVQTMHELMTSEYNTIKDQLAPWFEKEISKEEYFRVRSHVEGRVFNVSGTLIMIPALDSLHHSDDPNVLISFDDETQQMVLKAKHDVPSSTSLAIDYGVASRNKVSFLLEHGFIPRASADAAYLRVARTPEELSFIRRARLRQEQRESGGKGPSAATDIVLSHRDGYVPVVLTAGASGRAALVSLLREQIAAAKLEDDADDASELELGMVTAGDIRTALIKFLKAEIKAMPARSSLKLAKDAHLRTSAYERHYPESDAAKATHAHHAAMMEATAVALYDSHLRILEAHLEEATQNHGAL